MNADALEFAKDHSSKQAFHISCALHGLFFVAIVASSLMGPEQQPIPKKLIVHTVSLQSSSKMKTATSQKPAAITQKQEAPSSPVPEQPAIATPKEETSSPATELPSAKETTGEKTSDPTPSVAKASSKSKKPAQKSSAKPSTSKSSKSSKTTPRSTKSQPAKSAPKYDQKLLNEALSRLDKTRSTTKGTSSSKGATTSSAAKVGTVGALNAESGTLWSKEGVDDGDETYENASPEACYIGDLIRRLQLNVRLPEPGEVRVKLTIKKNGSVSSIQVLSKNKASIRQAIESKLKAVHFSPFGTSFPGENEHTFCLRLSNDLRWSCK